MTTDEKIPLLIAGGGGGLAFSRVPSLADVGGRIDHPGNGTDGFSAPQDDVSGRFKILSCILFMKIAMSWNVSFSYRTDEHYLAPSKVNTSF